MAQDGVSGEVLYPSLGLGFFCVEDPVFQESLFRTYNDWLIQYCKGAPDRLFGVALISAFDVDHAIAEMERCKKEGMVGTLIWQVPHKDLPFTSDHYERSGRLHRIWTCRCTCTFARASVTACTARRPRA